LGPAIGSEIEKSALSGSIIVADQASDLAGDVLVIVVHQGLGLGVPGRIS
jgi:hypothetical protein